MAVSNWQPEALDEILQIGDSQFLDALHRGFLPDAPNLSVEQLPTTVHFVEIGLEIHKQFLCFSIFTSKSWNFSQQSTCAKISAPAFSI